MSTNHSDMKRIWWISLPSLLVVVGILLMSCSSVFGADKQAEPTVPPTPHDAGNIKVTITNPGLTNVVIRVLDNPWVDTLADDGELLLFSCGDGQYITAWSPGYYIATKSCSSGLSSYEFTLTPYHVNDNAYYTWIEARSNGQLRSCEPCHSNVGGEKGEYLEWQRDGHSTIFKDPFFWTTYLGADVSRNLSPNTQWTIGANSQHMRMVPDLSKPYFGPGFKTDYPADNGNCAYCHAPASVTGAQTQVDLVPTINSANISQLSVSTEGVTCDVCHKVLSVRLGQDNKPFPDKPGILSFDFVREEINWNRLYVGPMPGANTLGTDVGVTCSPAFSQSQFCAPCHYAKFWDTQIYNSYGEWLESPYSDPGNEVDYKTCQACHMVVNNGTPQGNTQVKTVEREACSQTNISYGDFSHNMMLRGTDNLPALVQGAASLKVETNKVDGTIQTKVRVVNETAGHKFPTDSPLRHLILVIDARDKNGTLLPQVSGPQIPVWGGVGGNATLDFSGRPGEIYANILMDKDTNIAPAIDYWNPIQAAWNGSDTRLLPRKPVVSEYGFASPSSGGAVIKVRLLYRYAFIDLARQKGWSLTDVLVAESVVEVP